MKAIAEGMAAANAARPQQTLAEQVQRYVAIGASLLCMVTALVAVTGWAIQLQARMDAMTSAMDRVNNSSASLEAKLEQVLVEQWSRDDHERYHERTVQPLIDQVQDMRAARPH